RWPGGVSNPGGWHTPLGSERARLPTPLQRRGGGGSDRRSPGLGRPSDVRGGTGGQPGIGGGALAASRPDRTAADAVASGGRIILCLQSAIVLTPLDDLPFANVVGEVLLLLGLLTLPFAIAVAVLRYRLYEIERIISRTVTCGVVTALVVAVYLVTVFLLRLVMPVEGQLAVAGSTLATAALFNPLRRRVQELVDRHFNRDRYDAERILSSFTGRLRNRSDLDEVSRDLAEVTQRTVQPMSVALWLRTDAGER